MWLVDKTPHPDTESAEHAADHLALAGVKVEVELDSPDGVGREGERDGAPVAQRGQPRPARQEVEPDA